MGVVSESIIIIGWRLKSISWLLKLSWMGAGRAPFVFPLSLCYFLIKAWHARLVVISGGEGLLSLVVVVLFGQAGIVFLRLLRLSLLSRLGYVPWYSLSSRRGVLGCWAGRGRKSPLMHFAYNYVSSWVVVVKLMGGINGFE